MMTLSSQNLSRMFNICTAVRTNCHMSTEICLFLKCIQKTHGWGKAIISSILQSCIVNKLYMYEGYN